MTTDKKDDEIHGGSVETNAIATTAYLDINSNGEPVLKCETKNNNLKSIVLSTNALKNLHRQFMEFPIDKQNHKHNSESNFATRVIRQKLGDRYK